MSRKLIFIASLIFVMAFYSAPLVVTAATAGGGNTGGASPGGGNVETVHLINPLQGSSCGADGSANSSCLEDFLMGILKFIIRIGTIVVILMMVYVGFKFVAAQGNESKLSEAKSMLMWTVIGALILLGAQAIAIGIKETAQALSP
jgi:hypothetical protein